MAAVRAAAAAARPEPQVDWLDEELADPAPPVKVYARASGFAQPKVSSEAVQPKPAAEDALMAAVQAAAAAAARPEPQVDWLDDDGDFWVPDAAPVPPPKPQPKPSPMSSPKPKSKPSLLSLLDKALPSDDGEACLY